MKESTTEIDYYDIADTDVLDQLSNELAQDIKQPIHASIIVTVPAHNEEDTISSCIESLAFQEGLENLDIERIKYEIIVLCHKCTDRTYPICIELKEKLPNLNLHVLQTSNPNVNNVGAVRRILMNIASSRLKSKKGFIATTDADSVADKFWIANLSSYIGSIYGLICGKINIDISTTDGIVKKTLELKQEYFELVRLIENTILPDYSNPYPRHSDNSGPNLAIRGDVYKKIGGIKPIGFCEDIALYDNVIFNGFFVRHCINSIVKSSSRQKTRAPWGFGAELNKWQNSTDICFEVEGLECILAQMRIRVLLKNYLDTLNERFILEIEKISGLKNIRQLIEKLKHSELAVAHRIIKILEKDEEWNIRYPKQNITKAYADLKKFASENLLMEHEII